MELEISSKRLNQNKNHFLSKDAAGIEKNVAYWFGFNRKNQQVSAQFNPICESSVMGPRLQLPQENLKSEILQDFI
jgi:hypothetical protein